MKIKPTQGRSVSTSQRKFLPKLNKQPTSSLIEKIANNVSSNEKENTNTGVLKVQKLQDVIGDKCQYGKSCAHLRSEGECFYLHEKRDYQFLSIELPQKYLQNEDPLKKSKQQRKEDKILELAQRQNRLKEKLAREQAEQNMIQKMEEEKPQKKTKIQPKVIDPKETLIQSIVCESPQSVKSMVSVGELYKRLNHLTECFATGMQVYEFQGYQKASLPQFSSLNQIRRRLMLKMNKNLQLKFLEKQLIEKEGVIVRKLIKNILNMYSEQIELIKEEKSLDLTQIQELVTIEEIQRVMRTKKQNEHIVEYYVRFFSEEFGFPTFVADNQTSLGTKLKKGNLSPITEDISLLIILAPAYQFERKFIISSASFNSLKVLAEFTSLEIPLRIQQKLPVQNVITLEIQNLSFSQTCEQLMSEYLTEYHKKMKPPGKFVFGSLMDNVRKFINFIQKYKAKIESQNPENSFIIVIYGVKDLLDQIITLQLSDKFQQKDIKQDRSIQQEKCYEKVYILKQMLQILKSKVNNQKLKVVYIDTERLKMKKYRQLLSLIDEALKDQE